jgi:hypothetical protein
VAATRTEHLENPAIGIGLAVAGGHDLLRNSRRWFFGDVDVEHRLVDPVVCQKSIASSCGAPVVEVEQSAEPLAAFDRRVLIDGSHRLLDGREQPIADTLVVALKVNPRSE